LKSKEPESIFDQTHTQKTNVVTEEEGLDQVQAQKDKSISDNLFSDVKPEVHREVQKDENELFENNGVPDNNLSEKKNKMMKMMIHFLMILKKIKIRPTTSKIIMNLQLSQKLKKMMKNYLIIL